MYIVIIIDFFVNVTYNHIYLFIINVDIINIGTEHCHHQCSAVDYL